MGPCRGMARHSAGDHGAFPLGRRLDHLQGLPMGGGEGVDAAWDTADGSVDENATMP